MISKEKFVKIIDRLRATNETIEEINNILRNSIDTIEADFVDGASLMVCHEGIVVDLLDEMFGTEDVSWWIGECDYGRTFEIGYLSYEKDGKIVEPDLSTAEKLYDYLIERNWE